MRTVKRSVWYWGKWCGELYAIVVVVALIFTGIFALGTDLKPDGLLDLVVSLWYLVAVFALAVFMISWYENQMPMLLAFGCRRREAFVSLTAAKFLYGILTGSILALYLVLTGYGKDEGSTVPGIWLLLCSFACAEAGLGELGGCLYYRAGKIALIFVGVFCGGLGGLFGFVAGSAVDGEGGIVPELIRIAENHLWPVCVCCFLALASGTLASALTIRRAQVRM